MWDKVLLFISIVSLTYLLKNKSLVFNWIIFHSYFGLFYVCCAFLPIVWPFPLFKKRSLQTGIPWVRILKRCNVFFGLEWELRNGEVLAKDRGAVIVSNHQSSLDTVGVFNIWERAGNIIGLIKREIVYVWPPAFSLYHAGGVLLDRRNPRKAFKQLLELSDALIKEKGKVWMCPEGTRNYDYTKFLPFKKGAFVLAITAQTPIIPVIFSPYFFLDRKKYTLNKSRVIIQCLEEVPTTGLTMEDVPELIERVRNMMLAAYKELSDEVLPPSSDVSKKENEDDKNSLLGSQTSRN